MKAKKGDKVKVHYTGTLDNGHVFDSSNNDPLEFEVGSGRIIEGFEKAVRELNIGEEKEFTFLPTEAYGEKRDELVYKVPIDQIPVGKKVTAGMNLALAAPDGTRIPALISEVNDSEVTIDLNHPLAGKRLTFKIKLLEIIQA